MSLLSKTNLEEYARQCTVQRRRYEECLGQSHQSYTSQVSTLPTEAIAQSVKAGETVAVSQLNVSADPVGQSCMTDLLELPADDPLSWDDEDSVLDPVRNAAEVHQRHDNRPYTSRQTVAKPKVKSLSPVGYGAP